MRKIVGLLLAIIFAIAPLTVFLQPLPVQAATLTLLPNGEGGQTQGTYVGGSTNYTNLQTNDGDTTHVYMFNGGSAFDWVRTCTFDNMTSSAIVNSVTVHGLNRSNGAHANTYLVVRIAGTNYYSLVQTDALTYVDNYYTWATNPATGLAWTPAQVNDAEFGIRRNYASAGWMCTQLYVVVDYDLFAVPIVTTQAVNGNGYSAPNYIATCNGTITNTGGLTPDYRGFVWSTTTHGDPGNVAPVASAYSDNWTEAGPFTVGPFSHQVTSFAGATTYYVRSFAHNSIGWAYGNEVSFATLSPPVITTSSASSVSYSTARLNGLVTSDGGQLADVRFAYDNVTHAGGVFADYANATAWVNNTYSTGDHPYADITGLNFNTTYYYRIQIANDVTDNTGSEISFTTSNSVLKPNSISAIPSGTSISLSWVKGVGGSNTLARYKLGSYPLTVLDGNYAYLGTGNSVNITGLTAGNTYYMSLWGYTSGVYSSDYATTLATTVAYDSASTPNNIEVPANTGTFTQTPSEAKVATVPFHEAVEAISTSYGTPLNMVWYVVWMVIGLGGGILLYNRAGQGGMASYNLPMTFGIEAIWYGIGASIGLTMMWIVVFFLLVATGFTVFGNRH